MSIKKSFLTLYSFFSITLCYGQIDIFSEQISLDSVTNTASDETNVVISPDGRLLYFTRSNHSENIGGQKDRGDIWVSEKNETNEWTTAYNLKTLNNSGNNRIIGLTNDGQVILLRDGNDFALAYKNSGKWSKPKRFEIPYFNSKSKEFSASLSANGEYLLFGMESFGSYGVEDIYISRKKRDGSWTSPKNLGRQINTAYQEITPFLAADNKTLFFASNGHEGQGSFDIFMTTRMDDTWQNWSQPRNLGPKVNTVGKERSFTFLPNDEYAYLSSTQNSDGYGDLKKVKILPNIMPEEKPVDSISVVSPIVQKDFTVVSGYVFDKKTNEKVIGAEVHLVMLPAEKEYKALTNSKGAFNMTVDKGDSYLLKVKAFRYLSVEDVIMGAISSEIDTLIYHMEPVIEGNTVTLDHVLFEQGKATLIEGSQKELDLVVEMMRYNPDVSIFLAGHTDNQGKASLNIQLSEDRVQTVTDYLVSHGVNKKRISGKGYGGTKPIASNASLETRKLNRRVEFTVHKMKN